MTDDRFGPPPSVSYERAPSKQEIEFFRENGFLAVERITTDEEIVWLRRIFEFIFSEEYAGKPGSPLDRSGTPIPGQPVARLTQAFFPEMYFPEILNTQFRRNAKRFAAALLDVEEKDLSSWGHMIQKKPGDFHNVSGSSLTIAFHSIGGDVVEQGRVMFAIGARVHQVGITGQNLLQAGQVATDDGVYSSLELGHR